jgi:serine/threonine protein kinase, bacterial
MADFLDDSRRGVTFAAKARATRPGLLAGGDGFVVLAGRPYDSRMPLAEGQVFAGYTIVRLLGSGGMGQVYLAQHPRLPRNDALKILPANLTADAEYRQRFNREADLAARLSHPHIVGVHDRGEFEQQLWISMEYVEGTDAGRLLSRYPSGMPQAEVFEIVTAVADALDYAHAEGMLHRDVKPANILLGEATARRRRILLADFGIARELGDISGLTETNMMVGTVAYCAPEQLKGLDLDGRADEYALACTTFQLLTGSSPFQQSNPAVVISEHLSAPPPAIGERRTELAGLNDVLGKALAKKPEDRYPSCSDFAAAVVGHEPAQDAPTAATVVHATAAQTDPQTVVIGATAPPSRRQLRPGILIPAIVAIVLVVVVVVGAQLLRGLSQKHAAPSNRPVTPQPSFLLTRYITDRSGALTPSGHRGVQSALDQLYADRKVHLWVVYVDSFDNLGPFEWGQNAMRENVFTATDALLAVNTTLRNYAFQVPPAIVGETGINLLEVRRKAIEPAVLASDWSGAALAAVKGFDPTAVGG